MKLSAIVISAGLAAATGGAIAEPSDTPPADTVTVVVTARKRPEALVQVPQSVTAFPGQTLRELNITDFTGFATKTPNLALAYGNGATAIGDAGTIAIRGVSGAGTTAVYIDQTPVPDSIDPRVVDADHIEVLKGPQGTLYGEGSMGGNVRIVTNAPSLKSGSLDLMAEAGVTSHGGSANGGASVIGNVVAVPGKVAVRFVAFADHDAGYLSRIYPGSSGAPVVRGDQAAQSSYGGSVTGLFRVSDRLDLTLRVMGQRQDDLGFPAAFAPLPGFRPRYSLPRAFDIQPKVRDQWLLPTVDLRYRGEGWEIDSTTSYFQREIREVEDSTTGTAQFLDYIATPLAPQPYVWRGRRSRSQVSHETRLSFGDDAHLRGVLGVFYSRGRDDFAISPISGTGLQTGGFWPNDLLWLSDIRETQANAALFGELYYPVLPRLTVTLGARQYWLRQTYHILADGYLDGGLTDNPPGSNRESGMSPKAALSFQADAATQVYVSAGKGFRAGGSGQAVIPQCDGSLAEIGLSADAAQRYSPDTVWSYEVGAKHQLTARGLLMTAALYHLDWDRIQQSVFLPSCAFIITTNAGAAAADGGEFELAGRVTERLNIRFGLGYENARITKAGPSGQAVGSRVYQTPRWTVTTAGYYRWPLRNGASGFIGADASYVGDSISNNSGGGLALVRPAYGLINARFGVDWGHNEVSLNIGNLTDTKANLGDLGYLGYAQHDVNSPDMPVPQVAVLPPLSAVIQVRRRY